MLGFVPQPNLRSLVNALPNKTGDYWCWVSFLNPTYTSVDAIAISVALIAISVDAGAISVDAGAISVDVGAISVDAEAI
jgi:hypothetical protein